MGSEYIHSDADGLFFTDPEASCIQLEYPSKLEQLPFFARCLATIGYEDMHFEGALLWFTNWGIWNSRDERSGYRLIEAMNAAAGQPKLFEAAPGHRFRADELTEAVAILLQPMIFGWNADYVPTWAYGTGQFFLHVSHDSYVTIVTRTKEFHDNVFGMLAKLNLNPKASTESAVKRFCRA